MHIEVLLNGGPVVLPHLMEHGQLSGFLDALNSVRRAQSGDQYTPHFNTEVFEVRSYRPVKLLGHLGLCRYPTFQSLQTDSVDDEIAVINGPASHVVWMRHDAELVVKYDAKQRLETEGLQWAGVFKPVPEVDDSFAAAEPPAHDDWVPDAMQARDQKRDVRVALTRIRELVKDFLAPVADQSTTPPVRSVAGLADSLSGLVGSTMGAGPARRPSSRTTMSRPRRPQVRIADVQRRMSSHGTSVTSMRCDMSVPAGGEATLRASVGVGVEGGSDTSPELVHVLGWSTAPLADGEAAGLADSPPRLSDGESAWLLVEAAVGLAIDVTVTAAEDE
jgi:hypothetical protein